MATGGVVLVAALVTAWRLAALPLTLAAPAFATAAALATVAAGALARVVLPLAGSGWSRGWRGAVAWRSRLSGGDKSRGR
jgi:hypothetical protein